MPSAISHTLSANRFAYDLAGRITTQTLPDTRVIGYAYDGNGNVTSITPPGKPLHEFAYTPVDLESNYDPPPLAASPSPLCPVRLSGERLSNQSPDNSPPNLLSAPHHGMDSTPV